MNQIIVLDGGACMSSLLVVSLLLTTSFIPPCDNLIQKRAGETVHFQIDAPVNYEGMFFIYRKTGVTTQPIKIAELQANERTYDYVIPKGSTAEYRFFVIPVQNYVYLVGSNEILVRRIQ